MFLFHYILWHISSFSMDSKLRRKLNISTIALGYVTKHQWRCSLLEAFLRITIVRSIKCSTSVLVFCCLLTNHMIYLKLRQKVLLLQAEQISFLRKSSLWVKIVNNLWICIAFNKMCFCLSFTHCQFSGFSFTPFLVIFLVKNCSTQIFLWNRNTHF